MPQRISHLQTTGTDLVIAIDASNSMLSKDVKPSRLSAAKQLAEHIVDNVGDNRIGLVVFAGKPSLLLPLTNDLTLVRSYIDDIYTDAVPLQGTSIGHTLALCDAALKSDDSRLKLIILITDGEDQDSLAIPAAVKLANRDVAVLTVGVGSLSGIAFSEADTEEYKKDANGKVVISRLNEKLLQTIAASTKGSYFYLSSQEKTAKAIEQSIKGSDKNNNATNNNSGNKFYYSFFLFAALILLIIEIWIPETKGKTAGL